MSDPAEVKSHNKLRRVREFQQRHFSIRRRDIEEALLRAAKRGVRVRALIAYTNRCGEKHLRALEMRMLAAGITVARSAADMARYHGKMIIVDESRLYVLGFNFTYLDIEHSRSFGVILTDRKLVREAVKLFEADVQRHSYAPRVSGLLVSPVNARDELAAFIAGAKKALLIYDPNVSDGAMLRILTGWSKAGVQIRILGRAAKLPSRKMPQIRLHAHTIVRDRTWVSVGSQSLRTVELDGRREVGAVFRNLASARRIVSIFQSDWNLASEPETGNALEGPDQSRKIAKKSGQDRDQGVAARGGGIGPRHQRSRGRFRGSAVKSRRLAGYRSRCR